MNRLIRLALGTTLMAALLTGCATTNDQPDTTTPDTATPSTATDVEQDTTTDAVEGYSYSYHDVALALGTPFQTALDALGEPSQYFEAASCAFEGLDKIYYYPGLEIKTAPQGEDDILLNILLKDDSIATDNGTYIGMPIADALTAEGEDYVADGTMYTYTKGDTYLILIDVDGLVASINFGWAFE